MKAFDETYYRQQLDFLYGLQFFGIKLGLENIYELLERVGNPHQKLRIIHLAGTNGKGSTAAAIAATLHLAGITAGLYTSPHLHDFSERIRIDAEPISQPEVLELIELLRPHAEELKATFFEVTTAMALLCFARHEVEWAIVETGMGGRLDATNVVSPEVSILTSIAFDHSAYLGDNIADIAAEKAGIIKPDTTVISAQQSPDALQVIEARAMQVAAPLLLEGRDFCWQSEHGHLSIAVPGVLLEGLKPALMGRHQGGNMALAAAALNHLRSTGLELDDADIRRGLERVIWPGRLEQLPGNVLVDGAHNPAAARELAVYLAEQKLDELHLVIGCKGDKEAEKILASLLPFATKIYLAPPPVDEACALEPLADIAHRAGVKVELFGAVTSALHAAQKQRREGEQILAAGSLFLVAAVREQLLDDCNLVKIVA